MKNKSCLNYDEKNSNCLNCNYEDENRIIDARIILLECKSFYQVFKDIDPVIQKELESMRYVSNVTDWDEFDRISEKANLYRYAYVVNGAFATELALKFLYTLANIDYPRGNAGHDLLKLYQGYFYTNKKVVRNDVDELLRRLCADGTQNPDTIEKNVESFSDCYNRYRYLFSFSEAGTNDFFSVFVKTICDYVLSKESEIFND